MICRGDLPVAELREQAPWDASLHEYTTASMFNALDLPGFVEQRDQRTLLIWKPHKDRRVRFIKLLLDNPQQVFETGSIQSGNSHCLLRAKADRIRRSPPAWHGKPQRELSAISE